MHELKILGSHLCLINFLSNNFRQILYLKASNSLLIWQQSLPSSFRNLQGLKQKQSLLIQIFLRMKEHIICVHCHCKELMLALYFDCIDSTISWMFLEISNRSLIDSALSWMILWRIGKVIDRFYPPTCLNMLFRFRDIFVLKTSLLELCKGVGDTQMFIFNPSIAEFYWTWW